MLLALLGVSTIAGAGPYTDPGIAGFVDPNNRNRPVEPAGPGWAVLNPIFRGWATQVVAYQPAAGVTGPWADPNKALGPVTGEPIDIVSLGDLTAEQIAQGKPAGTITLWFDEPIRNGAGYDFVVFENAFASLADWGNGAIAGQIFAELAYVEVSSDGIHFARLPSVSLTPDAVGIYGTIDITNVHNLAGKHPNGYGHCVGTGFDLQDIAEQPDVVSGLVDINEIRYVRLVDIPGSGDFHDQANLQIDPQSWPDWANYAGNHPIYDAWVTFGSAGFDVEAVGVLHEQIYSADIDLNGLVDWFDFALLASAWHSRFGQDRWLGRCDLAEPKDLYIDIQDIAAFAEQWLARQPWRP